MQTIPSGAWVVVADGTHARLFHNIGERNDLQLRQAEVLTPENVEASARSAKEGSSESATIVEVDETLFARQLAQRLNAAALDHAFEHLFLVADPGTLGEIRPRLHVETTRRLCGELARTLTNSSLEDIEKSLAVKT